MKKAILFLLSVIALFNGIHNNEIFAASHVHRAQTDLERQGVIDKDARAFKNIDILDNRLAHESTIFELEELLIKINEDISSGIHQLKRNDTDKIVLILKKRKKYIKNQLEELKKHLTHYTSNNRGKLSRKAKRLTAAASITAGGLLFLMINHYIPQV